MTQPSRDPRVERDGPVVVAIGGGHGLARTLGASRRFAGALTAVVSVADDGGSTGRLRRDLAIPAPGDVRRALLALLPQPTPLGRAVGLRFAEGELAGHAFGNLLLVALAEVCGGFLPGVDAACRLLDTVGDVLPATSVPVTLCAEASGHQVAGQVQVMGEHGITTVHLDPPDATAPDAVLAAIAAADMIVVGPGSLYTSVLAALAPVGMLPAIAASRAVTVYVANLKEQIPETAGYDIGRHLAALRLHGFVPDIALVDTASIPLGVIPEGTTVLLRSLAEPHGAIHDEAALADALAEVSAPRR